MLIDEGIGGWVTFRNFRSPTRISSWRRNGFIGSIVVTKLSFCVFTIAGPLVDVPLGHESLGKLRISAKGDSVLQVDFDVADFHEDWSGQMECSFNTPLAREILVLVAPGS